MPQLALAFAGAALGDAVFGAAAASVGLSASFGAQIGVPGSPGPFVESQPEEVQAAPEADT